jgi:L-rhamnose mutarotase
MSPSTEKLTGRACFLLRVRPDRLAPYLEAHEHVWAEMQEALQRAGWADYSLFLDKTTGLVVGFVRTDDLAEAQERMAGEEINTLWQASMADYFEAVDSRVAPGEAIVLSEYFHLD